MEEGRSRVEVALVEVPLGVCHVEALQEEGSDLAKELSAVDEAALEALGRSGVEVGQWVLAMEVKAMLKLPLPFHRLPIGHLPLNLSLISLVSLLLRFALATVGLTSHLLQRTKAYPLILKPSLRRLRGLQCPPKPLRYHDLVQTPQLPPLLPLRETLKTRSTRP